MSKYKCVIFDCDGVLVDSEPIGNQVMVDMANALGADINLEYAYQHFKGNALKNCMTHISKLIKKELPLNFESEYRQRSFEKFEKEIQPIEGIKDVLENLKLPFCVASSGPETKMNLNLKHTGLLNYFEGKMFSCYTIQKWKPHPEIFLWAAKTMGFLPQECVVVEDSVTGVKAAINGGFDVFGFTAHDYRNELETIASKTLDSLLILPELLES